MEWVRFGIAGLFIAIGLFFMIVTMFGVYRFNYVLNRMHSAAMGDTLGIASFLIGLIVISGVGFSSLKLILVIVFFWLASPVASHLISRLEVTSNERNKIEQRRKE